MIRFVCSNCGQPIKVDDKYAGKKGKCPRCKRPATVPASEPTATLIKFRCPRCNQKIGLTADYAGKHVRCAKCRMSLCVPQVGGEGKPSSLKDELSLTQASMPSAQKTVAESCAGDPVEDAELLARAGQPSLSDSQRKRLWYEHDHAESLFRFLMMSHFLLAFALGLTRVYWGMIAITLVVGPIYIWMLWTWDAAQPKRHRWTVIIVAACLLALLLIRCGPVDGVEYFLVACMVAVQICPFVVGVFVFGMEFRGGGC